MSPIFYPLVETLTTFCLHVRTTCPHQFVEGYSIMVVPQLLKGFESVCLRWGLMNFDLVVGNPGNLPPDQVNF
jgi:hypothetical protein